MKNSYYFLCEMKPMWLLRRKKNYEIKIEIYLWFDKMPNMSDSQILNYKWNSYKAEEKIKKRVNNEKKNEWILNEKKGITWAC